MNEEFSKRKSEKISSDSKPNDRLVREAEELIKSFDENNYYQKLDPDKKVYLLRSRLPEFLKESEARKKESEKRIKEIYEECNIEIEEILKNQDELQLLLIKGLKKSEDIFKSEHFERNFKELDPEQKKQVIMLMAYYGNKLLFDFKYIDLFINNGCGSYYAEALILCMSKMYLERYSDESEVIQEYIDPEWSLSDTAKPEEERFKNSPHGSEYDPWNFYKSTRLDGNLLNGIFEYLHSKAYFGSFKDKQEMPQDISKVLELSALIINPFSILGHLESLINLENRQDIKEILKITFKKNPESSKVVLVSFCESIKYEKKLRENWLKNDNSESIKIQYEKELDCFNNILSTIEEVFSEENLELDFSKDDAVDFLDEIDISSGNRNIDLNQDNRNLLMEMQGRRFNLDKIFDEIIKKYPELYSHDYFKSGNKTPELSLIFINHYNEFDPKGKEIALKFIDENFDKLFSNPLDFYVRGGFPKEMLDLIERKLSEMDNEKFVISQININSTQSSPVISINDKIIEEKIEKLSSSPEEQKAFRLFLIASSFFSSDYLEKLISELDEKKATKDPKKLLAAIVEQIPQEKDKIRVFLDFLSYVKTKEILGKNTQEIFKEIEEKLKGFLTDNPDIFIKEFTKISETFGIEEIKNLAKFILLKLSGKMPLHEIISNYKFGKYIDDRLIALIVELDTERVIDNLEFIESKKIGIYSSADNYQRWDEGDRVAKNFIKPEIYNCLSLFIKQDQFKKVEKIMEFLQKDNFKSFFVFLSDSFRSGSREEVKEKWSRTVNFIIKLNPEVFFEYYPDIVSIFGPEYTAKLYKENIKDNTKIKNETKEKIDSQDLLSQIEKIWKSEKSQEEKERSLKEWSEMFSPETALRFFPKMIDILGKNRALSFIVLPALGRVETYRLISENKYFKEYSDKGNQGYSWQLEELIIEEAVKLNPKNIARNLDTIINFWNSSGNSAIVTFLLEHLEEAKELKEKYKKDKNCEHNIEFLKDPKNAIRLFPVYLDYFGKDIAMGKILSPALDMVIATEGSAIKFFYKYENYPSTYEPKGCGNSQKDYYRKIIQEEIVKKDLENIVDNFSKIFVDLPDKGRALIETIARVDFLEFLRNYESFYSFKGLAEKEKQSNRLACEKALENELLGKDDFSYVAKIRLEELFNKQPDLLFRIVIKDSEKIKDQEKLRFKWRGFIYSTCISKPEKGFEHFPEFLGLLGNDPNGIDYAFESILSPSIEIIKEPGYVLLSEPKYCDRFNPKKERRVSQRLLNVIIEKIIEKDSESILEHFGKINDYWPSDEYENLIIRAVLKNNPNSFLEDFVSIALVDGSNYRYSKNLLKNKIENNTSNFFRRLGVNFYFKSRSALRNTESEVDYEEIRSQKESSEMMDLKMEWQEIGWGNSLSLVLCRGVKGGNMQLAYEILDILERFGFSVNDVHSKAKVKIENGYFYCRDPRYSMVKIPIFLRSKKGAEEFGLKKSYDLFYKIFKEDLEEVLSGAQIDKDISEKSLLKFYNKYVNFDHMADALLESILNIDGSKKAKENLVSFVLKRSDFLSNYILGNIRKIMDEYPEDFDILLQSASINALSVRSFKKIVDLLLQRGSQEKLKNFVTLISNQFANKKPLNFLKKESLALLFKYHRDKEKLKEDIKNASCKRQLAGLKAFSYYSTNNLLNSSESEEILAQMKKNNRNLLYRYLKAHEIRYEWEKAGIAQKRLDLIEQIEKEIRNENAIMQFVIHSRGKSMSKMKKDPTYKYYEVIREKRNEWIKENELFPKTSRRSKGGLRAKYNPRFNPELREDYWIEKRVLLVARHIGIRGGVSPKNVTKEMVQKADLRLFEALQEKSEMPVFQGRNVVMYLSGRELKFKTKTIREAVSSQQKEKGKDGRKGDLDIFRYENGKEDGTNWSGAQEFRNALADKIENSPPPLTFIYDGHNMVDGTSRGSFLNSFKKRWKNLRVKYGDEVMKDENRDIIMVGGCFFSDELRNFAIEMSKEGLPTPIIVTESEYDHGAYTGRESRFGSRWMRYCMFNEDPRTLSTLGSMSDNLESNYRDGLLEARPTIFIPDPLDKEGNPTDKIDALPMQIAENDSVSLEEAGYA